MSNRCRLRHWLLKEHWLIFKTNLLADDITGDPRDFLVSSRVGLLPLLLSNSTFVFYKDKLKEMLFDLYLLITYPYQKSHLLWEGYRGGGFFNPKLYPWTGPSGEQLITDYKNSSKYRNIFGLDKLLKVNKLDNFCFSFSYDKFTCWMVLGPSGSPPHVPLVPPKATVSTFDDIQHLI